MTPPNMARHRNSPRLAFWKMIKQGYDRFEVTRLEPRVDVCETRYIFDAESTDRFSPAERGPAYKVREDIAVAVREKQHRDDVETVELINRGTPHCAGYGRRRRRHESDLPGGREVAQTRSSTPPRAPSRPTSIRRMAIPLHR
jgi:hypothetical protein